MRSVAFTVPALTYMPHSHCSIFVQKRTSMNRAIIMHFAGLQKNRYREFNPSSFLMVHIVTNSIKIIEWGLYRVRLQLLSHCYQNKSMPISLPQSNGAAKSSLDGMDGGAGGLGGLYLPLFAVMLFL